MRKRMRGVSPEQEKMQQQIWFGRH